MAVLVGAVAVVVAVVVVVVVVYRSGDRQTAWKISGDVNVDERSACSMRGSLQVAFTLGNPCSQNASSDSGPLCPLNIENQRSGQRPLQNFVTSVQNFYCRLLLPIILISLQPPPSRAFF